MKSNIHFHVALFCFPPTPERNIGLFSQPTIVSLCSGAGKVVYSVLIRAYFSWKQLPASAGDKDDKDENKQNENNEQKEAKKLWVRW